MDKDERLMGILPTLGPVKGPVLGMKFRLVTVPKGWEYAGPVAWVSGGDLFIHGPTAHLLMNGEVYGKFFGERFRSYVWWHPEVECFLGEIWNDRRHRFVENGKTIGDVLTNIWERFDR